MWKIILPAIVLLAAFLSWPVADLVQVQTTENHSAQPADISLLPSYEAEQSQVERLFMQRQQEAQTLSQQLMIAKQQGAGNMQKWLEQAWKNCQRMGVAACEKWQQILAEHLSPNEQLWLSQALQNYTSYQQEMQSFHLDETVASEERYQQIKQLRERYLAEKTQDIFGQEDQYAQYQFAYAKLQKNSANFDVEERLAQLEKLQSQAKLGELKEQLLGPDTQYQQALNLLSDLSEAEQQQWRTKLQERYFGDKAKDIAVYEAQQQAHRQQQLNYQQQLQVLQQRWQGQLNSLGYQQALQVLRDEAFAK